MRIAIKTLGCKSNRYESDKVFDELRNNHDVFELNEGISTFTRIHSAKPDLLIVNTCTVTHVADRKSRQAIRSFKKINPDCKVIAFGCGVNVSPEKYKEIEEVDFLAEDSKEVLKFTKELSNDFEKCEYEGNAFDKGFRTRALVKIQDGCNSYCSYCIIPTARGPEYSFSSKEILEEVLLKETAGFKEIVLTGINIAEWKEGDMNLADLFEMLLNKTKTVRFRVSSIEPKNFSDKFYELFKHERFCPHMHMSLQSGCDSVLKRMRRKYMTDTFKDVCLKLREIVPDMALTTDVIVGFPGETDKEFDETCKFIEEIGFLQIHVFPYSKREKTVAAYMKDHVADNVKKERCKKLRDISNKLGLDFKKSLIGQEYEVIIESISDGIAKGFTKNYLPVQFNCSESIDMLNKKVKLKLEKLLDNAVVEGVLLQP